MDEKTPRVSRYDVDVCVAYTCCPHCKKEIEVRSCYEFGSEDEWYEVVKDGSPKREGQEIKRVAQ